MSQQQPDETAIIIAPRDVDASFEGQQHAGRAMWSMRQRKSV
jgi:hypothetical protein